MGLDAYVFCDCFEKGRLRGLPPCGISLHILEDGSLDGETDGLSLEAQIAFDAWKDREACEHPRGILLHHRLGNIALIGLLRSEVSREPKIYPTLLSKVLYSGTHASDYLPVEMFPVLEEEVGRLRSFRCQRSPIVERLQQRWPRFGKGAHFRLPSTRADAFVQAFRVHMEELLAAAKRVHKPISF